MAAENTTQLFTKIIERVRMLDPVNTRKWFDDLAVGSFNGGVLEVICPDQAAGDFLKDNCLNNFTRAAGQITGHLVSVKFVPRSQNNGSSAQSLKINGIKLHPDYTFDTFVVGPGNRLAHASCVAVCNSPGTTYNPLFLYGSVGLGKTHLLHAICAETKKNISDARIQFLSCEEFVNRFIGAIEQGTVHEFQNTYRNVDLMVIDDVQFLSEREHSQEEFFHTFNALYNNRKQIVLSADCAPSDLASLEERLVSRFKWGLVARIDQPTFETRIAILKKKAAMRGFEIPDDVVEYIAKAVTSNIRELEGALTTIYAISKSTGREVSLDLAAEALGKHNEITQRQINITDIIGAVTDFFNVRLTDLQSKKRSQSIALPRQMCMYLARSLTRHSLEEIGGHLGGRDHTTVMHACAKIAELEKTDEQIHAQLEELTRRIKK